MRLTSKFILINYEIWPQVLIAAAGKTYLARTNCSKFKSFPNLSANGGSFLYGVSLGWSSTSEVELLYSPSQFTMTKTEFSWSVSMMCLGAALSCVISGIIRDRFGTKKTIFVFAVPSVFGWLMITFAWNPEMV